MKPYFVDTIRTNRIRFLFCTLLTTSLLLAHKLTALTQSTTNPPAVSVAPWDWGSEHRGFRLSVLLEKTHFGIGEEISVAVVVTNTTNAILTLPNRAPHFDNKFVVTDTKGNRVAFTDRGRILDGDPRAAQFYGRGVPAHGTTTDTMRIDDRFELDTAGTYFVTVRRVLQDEKLQLEPELTSNSVKFEIVPTESHSNEPPQTDGISY
jgi:hypothetical protein